MLPGTFVKLRHLGLKIGGASHIVNQLLPSNVQKKLALSFTSFVITLLLCLFLGEWVLRSYGLGDPIIYYKDAAYGYALEPSQRSVRLRNSVVTINESGLRSQDNWQLAKGKRILFIGDSVTYGGSYVDDSEIFSTFHSDRDLDPPPHHH